MVTRPPNHSPAKRPTSPTKSLRVIASAEVEARKKKKASGKSFFPTLWDDANATALKAYKALSMDDLSLLMAKSFSEVMSSHIQKHVQVCAVNCLCFYFFFCFTFTEGYFCRLWGSLC